MLRENLRCIHRESSYLAHNLELKYFLLLEAQVGRFLENLRDLHWEMFLVQDLERWEVLLMAVHMYMASFRGLHWDMIFLQWRKDLQGCLIRMIQGQGLSCQ